MITLIIKLTKSVIIVALFLCLAPSTARAEIYNGMAASVVIGEPDFVTGAGGTAVNVTKHPVVTYSDGNKLFIADYYNHRVLIYNSIPTTNGASADVVIGQSDFDSGSANPGGVGANTLNYPWGIYTIGGKLFIADMTNNRVLIYNTIPTTNGASADVVIGQQDFTTNANNQTGSATPGPNTLRRPDSICTSNGRNLIIADALNHRVLIYNSIPTTNNASADVVIGQSNFVSGLAHQGGSAPTAYTLNQPYGVQSDGKRLFVCDGANHRVLIYNSIPTTNNASADVVIGQENFNSASTGTTANRLNNPRGIYTDGKRLYIAEYTNSRVLVYNTIPTKNNTSADFVLGQTGFTSSATGTSQTQMKNVRGVFSDGKRLFVAEGGNNRVLIFNIGGSSIDLGPQFEQGKAVLGKVFNDIDRDGWQDEEELGIEGVKVASDTGIYAITDEDGKYHFPYIETGQHLLKIDESTLPEGSSLTTESPRKIIVTKGILTKVSFGVSLPAEAQPQAQSSKDTPLLKVSISQDPVLLKPKLSVSTEQTKDKITFNINTNYSLFIEKAELLLYDQDYKQIMTIPLRNPLPSSCEMNTVELPDKGASYHYQLSVYDTKGRQDRTDLGTFRIE